MVSCVFCYFLWPSSKSINVMLLFLNLAVNNNIVHLVVAY